ncbi:MAG: SGNH/GDSL hydrolase family protein [Chitinophagales bacterium]|nr:SGNH/GDSL hydrolase family protein [Chitinophagales bacterium]
MSKIIQSFSPLFLKIKYFITVYLIIEFILILIKPESIYLPGRYGQYTNNTIANINNYYHISKPGDYVSNKEKEFVFERKQNSLGLSDKEWIKEKPNGTYRIVCLGDSFTEGDGVDYEHSYVQALQRILNKKYKNIEVLNAGKRGSDPFFNFKYLEDKLVDYQPDMVIQSFTTNDYYYDFVERGGMERFGENGILNTKRDFWWEPVYAASYTARILIQTLGGYDKYLIKKSRYEQSIEEMQPKTIDLFKEYQQFSKEHQFDLVVFTLPLKNDYQGNKENEKFYQAFHQEFLRFNLHFYNLKSCYDSYIENQHASYKDYYWKKDGHHNAKGYEMMAECIEEMIEPVLLKHFQP